MPVVSYVPAADSSIHANSNHLELTLALCPPDQPAAGVNVREPLVKNDHAANSRSSPVVVAETTATGPLAVKFEPVVSGATFCRLENSSIVYATAVEDAKVMVMTVPVVRGVAGTQEQIVT